MFPRMIPITFLFALICLPVAVAQQKTGKTDLGKPQPLAETKAPDPARLNSYLDRWEKDSLDLRTLVVSCKRSRYSQTLKEQQDVYEGTIKFLKSGKVFKAAMDLKRIDGRPKPTDFEKIVFTGNFLYEFAPRTQEVKVYEVPKAKAGGDESFMPFLSGMKADDAKKRYDIKLTKEDDDWIYIEIFPRLPKDKTEFIRAQIVFRRQTFLPQRIWYVEPNKDTITFNIQNIQRNVRLTNADFDKPELPKGWKFKPVEKSEDLPPRVARPQK